MRTIKKLSQEQISKIAAGQVISRPVDIVKELIENALDAQATNITIFVKAGGKESLRIIDNGGGIPQEEIPLAFSHHATSKLTTVEDLAHLATFGFRGEALASIKSVASIQLTTKTQTAAHGVTYVYEKGAFVETKITACNRGTDITITDLFCDIPARKKFLKSDAIEIRHILSLVHATALSHTQCAFTLHVQEKRILYAPKTDTLCQRVLQLWPHLEEKMIPCSTEKPSFALSGYISKHTHARYDRKHLFFFVNHRWIKSYKLCSALIKAYNNILPPGRYPSAALFITVDPKTIDINVHPKKEEIVFSHPHPIQSSIKTMVTQALERELSNITTILPSTSFIENKAPVDQPPSFYQSSPPEKTIPLDNTNTQYHATVVPSPPINKLPHLEKHRPYSVIGIYKKTYIIIQTETGICLIDQHAAHERVLYEQYKNKKKEQSPLKTKLAVNHLMTLNPTYIDCLQKERALFDSLGFSFQLFAHNQLRFTHIADNISSNDIAMLIAYICKTIQEGEKKGKETVKKEANELLYHKLYAKMACAAAVKSGDSLTQQQVYELLDTLHATANKTTCPHGRPTYWPIDEKNIQKSFKRRL